MVDEHGKPILDEEGGTLIEPEKGFVIKTKDAVGGKVFVNMTQHEVIDPFEERAVPMEHQKEHGCAEVGLRVPLSLGTVREDFDKKGEPAQVYDVVWNPATIKRCFTDASFRNSCVELVFNYILQKH